MPNAPTDLKGVRTRACDACRGLKLRCDSHKFDYGPCSRCRRLSRDCVISANPKKRNRQTKAELENELNQLRSRIENAASADVSTASSNLPPAASTHPVGDGRFPWAEATNAQGSSAVDTASTAALGSVNSFGSLPGALSSSVPSADWATPHDNVRHQAALPPGHVETSNRSQPSSAGNASGPVHASPKSIDGVLFGAHKLSDCFTRFFSSYAPNVPGIFDRDQDPDAVHQSSEFLYWTIVHVGARRSKDPTIVESLTRPLLDLAQRSLLCPEQAVTSIRAVIALCLWPIPINSTFKDPTHAFCGAALQLAIQKGLPFASRKQDFARFPVEQAEKDGFLYYSRLWAYFQWISQSNNLCDGLPCIPTMQVAQAPVEQDLFAGLPAPIGYRFQLHQILVEAVLMIMRTVDLNYNTDSRMLRSLIEHFDTTMQRVVASGAEVTTAQFHLLETRLFLLCYYFFHHPDANRDAGLIRLHAIACGIIEAATELDEKGDSMLFCTHSQARAVVLAGFCILRTHRSHLRDLVDTQRGEEAFFEAIRMSRKRSIQNNDLESRSATILTQLWSSAKLFKFKDGSVDGLRLLLRGRLHMSVLFDSLWWWRSEFGGSTNPYIQSDPSVKKSNTSSSSTTTINVAPTTTVDPPLDQTQSALHDGSVLNLDQVPEWLMDFAGMSDWQWDVNFTWNPAQNTF
ncbi:uncharacterized protein PV09_08080 [Verruconis gallopava]|uniref:Zn(2)-C6 fungal-type domain-containing protein n=1 Tax=Verruconis gallopava TaxID=253628 RepID=A0A0D2A125_9PEZI|nr:uncharacterized protein PV09_08080 [Verruconis gallopava]KIW00368.1 hypothetical protein PV09_08080 [Verruconis gallopava]